MQTNFLSAREKLVLPSDAALQYMGRIDFDDPLAPVFVYPYTSVKMRFTGKTLKVFLQNNHAYWGNTLGFVLDGVQGCVPIPESGKPVCITLAEALEDREHELFFFKRMDSCHTFAFLGFAVEKDACISAPSPEALPNRRLEVYGDSVSAGEVSEAIAFVGKADPEHNGEFSNSYYSYAAIAARRLNARIHDIAQGGIALLHGTGWFAAPDYVGLEETWDKIEYNPDLGSSKPWDFSRYTPHVVLLAIGQNDNNPVDYMKESYDCAEAKNWRNHYETFVRKLRATYLNALIVLATTILMHDASWDRSIEEVCRKINDPKVVHLLYSRNGNGTPGHIRIPEAEEMAGELCTFLESFGESIWES